MKKIEVEVVHKTIGILLILVGVVSYIFPIPGSTLLIALGFVWLIGKNKTLFFLKKFLGSRIFKLLKIGKIVNEI